MIVSPKMDRGTAPAPIGPPPAGLMDLLRRQPLPRVAELLYDRPLMLTEAKAREIDAAVGERLLLGAELPEANPPGQREQSLFDPERDIERGIAVLDVAGTMVHRARGLRALSGVTSYAGLRSALLEAATHPAVRGIVLQLDTPGGAVNGAFDLADDIRRVSANGIPVYAAADDQATSAGYLLAAAADRFYVTRTSLTGSIGVILMHVSRRELEAEIGIRRTIIRSGRLKARPTEYEDLTEEDAARLTAEVDRFHRMFVEAVAGMRGVSAAAIDETESAALNADEALRAGLADELGTVRDAVEALRRRVDGVAARRAPGVGVMRAENQTGGDPVANDNLPDATPSTEEPRSGGAAPAAEEARRPERELLQAASRYRVSEPEVLGAAARMASDAEAVDALQLYAIVRGRIEAGDFAGMIGESMTIRALRDRVAELEARRSRDEDVLTAALPHEGVQSPEEGSGAVTTRQAEQALFAAVDRFNASRKGVAL